MVVNSLLVDNMMLIKMMQNLRKGSKMNPAEAVLNNFHGAKYMMYVCWALICIKQWIKS